MHEIKDRTGEKRLNKNGQVMEVIRYKNKRDIDVMFEDGFIAKNIQYVAFKVGNVKNLLSPKVHNIGYLGVGEYSPSKDGKATKCYNQWKMMLFRCYGNMDDGHKFAYDGCFVCEEWHNFQNFAKWYYLNFKVPELNNIDKDILFKGNKEYSPDKCVFVSKEINSLFTKRERERGEYPIGVYKRKNKSTYDATCSWGTKQKWLGTFNTQEEAFEAYKQSKEAYIKEVANKYRLEYGDLFDNRIYDAMMRYEVDIND